MTRKGSKLRQAYIQHQQNARKRDIPWYFTYVGWCLFWIRSGHLHERGPGKNQYCMSRPGDKGPYAPWNVRIILKGENTREAWLGKKHKASTRKKISENHGMLGKTHSMEAKAKIGRAHKGNKYGLGNRFKHTSEAKRKISAAMIGNKHSSGKKNALGYRHTEETKAKIAVTSKRMWRRQKEERKNV